MGLLKRVEPYIAFGYPNLKSVRELVLKRGYAKVNHNRLPLSDNKIIEEVRGRRGGGGRWWEREGGRWWPYRHCKCLRLWRAAARAPARGAGR